MSINRPLTQVQPYWNNSVAIRQEIQRFESVHPSIYAIYDLIESIPDPVLGQQIRDHVVCIEGKDFKLVAAELEKHFCCHLAFVQTKETLLMMHSKSFCLWCLMSIFFSISLHGRA
jgi:Arf-GAP/GTPase/ANK repeat/PH domain-containing protein 1/3